jgi:predicted outer membrane repeat protein
MTFGLYNLAITRGSHNSQAGAIFNSGITIVNDCIVSQNAAVSEGGAIYNSSDAQLEISNSAFTINQALDGGAIFSDGVLTISGSTFSNNITTNLSTGEGGAIHIPTANSATVSGSTFDGNQAGYGGGIYSEISAITVSNSTFHGNSAVNGGGYYKARGGVDFFNDTFSHNAASGSGAGIYNDGPGTELVNTILANSTSGGDCYSNTALSSDSNNLIESHTGCGTPVSTADPMLGALGGNGGPTMTMALLSGSPAKDAGDNTVCADPPVSSLDQRGFARPSFTTCDIGAFELGWLSWLPSILHME